MQPELDSDTIDSTASGGIPCDGADGPREDRFQGQSAATTKNPALGVDRKLLVAFTIGDREAAPPRHAKPFPDQFVQGIHRSYCVCRVRFSCRATFWEMP